MRKIYQKNEDDCFSACIASLTSIPYEEIPKFHSDSWMTDATKWLRKRGYQFIHCRCDFLDKRRLYILCVDPFYDYGYSFSHAVISKGLKVIHDPGRYRVKKKYSMLYAIRLKKL